MLKKFKLYKNSWISSKTIEKVNFHLSNGDQVLFFLNRRGFSPYVLCKNCLKVFSCPNCSINLVYHKQKKNLLCHYCGHKEALDRKCDKNGKCEFAFSGPGVERISEEVKKIFPQFKSLIFSSDTMNKKSSLELLEKIINNEIKIFSCGPSVMMESLKDFSNKNDIDCDLALETVMACGFGICQGCTLEYSDSNSENHSYRSKYGLVCLDGPIFSSKKIKTV